MLQRPKQPGYQLCPGCRKQKETAERLSRQRTRRTRRIKGIDPRVNKAVRKLCYSLSATGCFDDGIPEAGPTSSNLSAGTESEPMRPGRHFTL